jgi:hypothetical protein
MAYGTAINVGERVSSLFQPDTLLPAQYLDTFRRKAHLEPEKRLMLALLEDAIACFQKYLLARDAKGKMIFREAEEWITERESDWLFSFDSVSEALGFNPQYLREGLVRWKEAKAAGRSRAKIYRLKPRKERWRGATGSRKVKVA